MLPTELTEEYRAVMINEQDEYYPIVKAADKITAYIKCITELNSGNREFLSASKNLLSDINSYSLPEVKYYMENCMPSFSLSLDELN